MTGGSRSLGRGKPSRLVSAWMGVRNMMSSPLKVTLVSAGMALPSGRRSWLKSLW
ncbi:hypothetical protein D3C80_560680 [compost metagenome]